MKVYRSAISKKAKQLVKISNRVLLLFLACCLSATASRAQGVWTPLTNLAPDYNEGVMLLLTDGTVLVKTSTGGIDNYGAQWDRLFPDIHGSYVNGTWLTSNPMYDSRLYFSSQVLKNGAVYVAGGEYGTGGAAAEVYDPQLDVWTPAPPLLHISDTILDANSEILPDGRVLQAVVITNGSGFVAAHTYIYDPVTNTYSAGPNTLGSNDESSWLKLPDNSILFVDIFSTNAERYIPATHTWIADAPVPVDLYDPFGYEEGAAFLLPDGRGFFLGSTNATAYYTPSGNTSPGTWTTGPAIPDSLGAPDAAAAMMVDGNILCAFAHTPTFDSVFYPTTTFYVFNPTAETFTKITAPDGTDSLDGSSYITNMLCLPDGSIMYSNLGDDQYYIYKPANPPLAAGKPVITSIVPTTSTCDTFRATGHLFNGITEGACYGDDWQMNTNYPIIRLSRNDTVIYTGTYNWNSTGLMRGTLPDTTTFVLPYGGIPHGTYNVQVVANGNASNNFSYTFCEPAATGVNNVTATDAISVYPNPASDLITISYTAKNNSPCIIKLIDTYGRIARTKKETAVPGQNTYTMPLSGIAKGVYSVTINDEEGHSYNTKVVVE